MLRTGFEQRPCHPGLMVGRGTGLPAAQVEWRGGWVAPGSVCEDLRSLLSSAPAFVAAMVLSPAEWGDEDGDDEIFFFFTETSRVLNSYERIKVPRVARVCAVSSLSWLCVICWRLSFCLLLSGSALPVSSALFPT